MNKVSDYFFSSWETMKTIILLKESCSRDMQMIRVVHRMNLVREFTTREAYTTTRRLSVISKAKSHLTPYSSHLSPQKTTSNSWECRRSPSPKCNKKSVSFKTRSRALKLSCLHIHNLMLLDTILTSVITPATSLNRMISFPKTLLLLKIMISKRRQVLKIRRIIKSMKIQCGSQSPQMEQRTLKGMFIPLLTSRFDSRKTFSLRIISRISSKNIIM